ncbi:MAG TPA: pyrrolo-quinoline quinone [Terriglobales bacterium]|nr:pyrrolo-quinoline quinone [Terriglobales bacterium]
MILSRIANFSCALLLLVPTLFATDVVTYHNDNARTGQNTKETLLTPLNVNASTFGKLMTLSVDGIVDAQPLYLANVTIPGQGVHNVLYAATENDSVYAFDADTGTLYWQVSLVPAGQTPGDMVDGCNGIVPTIGVTSTPVIDRSSGPNGTIFVVGMTKDALGNYHQYLHALDVTTGAEEFSGPADIQAQYPGTGDNSQNGFVIFDPKQYVARASLLLMNHVIYTAWASHCDARPYTGWIIGYNENLIAGPVINVTPNGIQGAIWQSGAGLAGDGTNIFLLDANGTFDDTFDSNGFPSQGDYGNGFIKLSTANKSLAVADYFNMYNTISESDSDSDLGSGGTLLLPPMKDSTGTLRNLAVAAGKDTNLYIVDRNNMGKFTPGFNNIWQEIDRALPYGVWGAPAYFNGSLYYGPQRSKLMQFRFKQALLSTFPSSKSPTVFSYPGTTPCVSANGNTNGIVWAIEHGKPGALSVLHAYSATTLGQELYNSNQAANKRDSFGQAAHLTTPTVVNGKVYIGTLKSIAVFGLLQ